MKTTLVALPRPRTRTTSHVAPHRGELKAPFRLRKTKEEIGKVYFEVTIPKAIETLRRNDSDAPIATKDKRALNSASEATASLERIMGQPVETKARS